MDSFYNSIGGLAGYQLKCLEMMLGSKKDSPAEQLRIRAQRQRWRGDEVSHAARAEHCIQQASGGRGSCYWPGSSAPHGRDSSAWRCRATGAWPSTDL